MTGWKLSHTVDERNTDLTFCRFLERGDPLIRRAFADQLIDTPPSSGDLLFGRLAEPVSRHAQLFRHLTIAEDLHFVERSFRQVLCRQRLESDFGTILKASLIWPTLTANTVTAQRLLKPRLGTRRNIGIAPPWKLGLRL